MRAARDPFLDSRVNEGRVLAVIPARIGSERLPEKPLYTLAGRPLIEWVWRRVCALSTPEAVVVATDSERVVAACGAFGAKVELTSREHVSGTDRVAEIARRTEYEGYDIIVNVQGDEPFLEEAEVRGAVDEVRRGREIGTAATPVRTLVAWRDPAVVKVARRSDGAALYFTRSPIPHHRAGEPGPELLSPKRLASSLYLRHVGVYAYTRAALLAWSALPQSALEAVERLEQLRPLEAGMTIGVALVDDSAGGIDTPEDARRAEARLRGESPEVPATRKTGRP